MPRARGQRHATFLRQIFDKTDGHCHFCGDPLTFRNRGWSSRPRGHWEADHVAQKGKGGDSSVANYLPACTMCNRLRWHRTGPELQLMLLMGVIATREMRKGTALGDELRYRMEKQLADNKKRRLAGRVRPLARARRTPTRE
jgi:hypothetical protein